MTSSILDYWPRKSWLSPVLYDHFTWNVTQVHYQPWNVRSILWVGEREHSDISQHRKYSENVVNIQQPSAILIAFPQFGMLHKTPQLIWSPLIWQEGSNDNTNWPADIPENPLDNNNIPLTDLSLCEWPLWLSRGLDHWALSLFLSLFEQLEQQWLE